ncbi:TRAP transporter small permease [Vibrio spartinae]|uniref:TRAP transporter small permease protein n=1 Tax=Vibrio spartinae TaxID=1918945 RepID=A0A1N6M0C8_9VIBR|nr:TRAP transporter small permease [Vibrio spartinae]SIO92841.1 Sialic acid TRAP transporter permease protein SiaT [Vibrio spartinae]
MDKLIGVINRGLSMFCIGLSSVLVICVVWQVFSRYVLNTPSTTTDELARFLFIWVGLMGAAYTLGQKRHLAIELLEQILENKPAKLSILRLVVNVISLLFASVIMVYGGGKLMLHVLETGQISPSLSLQMGYVYAAIPLSGMFMLIYLSTDFLTNLRILMCNKSHKADSVANQLK